jgi:hypothetical protein
MLLGIILTRKRTTSDSVISGAGEGPSSKDSKYWW